MLGVGLLFQGGKKTCSLGHVRHHPSFFCSGGISRRGCSAWVELLSAISATMSVISAFGVPEGSHLALSRTAPSGTASCRLRAASLRGGLGWSPAKLRLHVVRWRSRYRSPDLEVLALKHRVAASVTSSGRDRWPSPYLPRPSRIFWDCLSRWLPLRNGRNAFSALVILGNPAAFLGQPS